MKDKIEAILFASSDPLSPSKIAKVIGSEAGEVEKAIEELIRDYSSRETSIEIVKLGKKYLMRVKPEYSEIIRNFTERDLEKGVLRTLAIIAIKQPVKLSELAKIRGNRCYEHVKKLREMGFITEEKKGRSTILRTTKNFAIYFGLKSSDPEEIKETLLRIVKKDRKLEEYFGRL
ncbi:SMC-Scp complex subunit ScpB [Geoglobus acetivorans]|uniref:SMC-Scp complex subunit ScpB n=1 Tax=Geoglobus acetivorans TaxID=565033 RepID=A0ABZ3H4H3_GEOAI|nr:SMC-Scp complex subunit ScpB [Geoglobus acetivorans]